MIKTAKHKTPWPTKNAMEQVYENKLWGAGALPFYSGEGSHLPEIIAPYIKTVTHFLRSFKNSISVCDLGCGDFNVGQKLVPFTKKYEAVDIVTDLIKHNKKTFINENLHFYCLDISKDTLPQADCVILRQVLQHLSNAEILKIVKKLAIYKYLILTEHLPHGEFIANVDIISGQGTRLKKNSGVNLLTKPFLLNVIEKNEVLTVDLDNNKGRIVTTIFTLY